MENQPTVRDRVDAVYGNLQEERFASGRTKFFQDKYERYRIKPALVIAKALVDVNHQSLDRKRFTW